MEVRRGAAERLRVVQTQGVAARPARSLALPMLSPLLGGVWLLMGACSQARCAIGLVGVGGEKGSCAVGACLAACLVCALNACILAHQQATPLCSPR